MPRETSEAVNGPARFVDGRAGTEEVAEFLPCGTGERLLALRTTPAGRPATGGVLVCSSIANDLVKHYRREVLLARALAGAGLAVQRFQYRGTGNSDGDPADLDRDSMVADAATAAAELDAAVPGAPAAVVGTRFGALVAAEVAAGDTRPVVLVEPVLDGSRYFTEAFRAKLMQGLATAKGERPTAATFRSALERGEVVDVLGTPVHRALHDSWQGRTVVDALAGPSRPVLLVQFGDDLPLRADLAKAATALREAGHDVDVAQVPGRETWWYLDERELIRVGGGGHRVPGRAVAGEQGDAPPDRPAVTDGLIGAVVPWVAAQLSAARSAR